MSDKNQEEVNAENIISIDKAVVKPQVLDLDSFKSFFYLYNGKPDTEIRLLKGGKVVEISDIISLEEKISEKLRNHKIEAKKTHIAFTLTNQIIKDFSTWAEFERAQWDTVNAKIESLSIHWIILIKLPQYKSPQPHSIKLRIGTAISLKDMFNLLLTSDDNLELIEANSPGICKVYFINNIIAQELLFIVQNWHEGLAKKPEPDSIETFLINHGLKLSRLVRNIFQ